MRLQMEFYIVKNIPCTYLVDATDSSAPVQLGYIACSPQMYGIECFHPFSAAPLRIEHLDEIKRLMEVGEARRQEEAERMKESRRPTETPNSQRQKE